MGPQQGVLLSEYCFVDICSPGIYNHISVVHMFVIFLYCVHKTCDFIESRMVLSNHFIKCC